MKRLKATLLAVLVAVLGLMCLTACGAKEGVYKFSYMKMTQGAMTIEIKAGESYMGMTLSEDFMVLELKEDGTATMSVDGMGTTETVNGTWTENAEDKNKVDIDFADGVPVTFECNGKTLYANIDGTELELKKS